MKTDLSQELKWFEVSSSRTGNCYTIRAVSEEDALRIATKEKREFDGYFDLVSQIELDS